MDIFTRISSWIVLHWRTSAVITCAGLAAGIAVAAKRSLETSPPGVQRAERKREKELRTLARKISSYARNVHKCYPTGDVVVSQVDLAMRLRKSPEAVATALSLMLGEQRVQRAALNGYWKLDV
jgi:hypothetical protein